MSKGFWRMFTILFILITLLLLVVDNKILNYRVDSLEKKVSQMQNAHE